MNLVYKGLLIISAILIGFGVANNANIKVPASSSLINRSGTTIQTRFIVPEGFERKQAAASSFATYLRSLPLKSDGSPVKYYNGSTKTEMVYDAVVNMDIGNKDLQQCADAVMRLRGEYFYTQKRYDKISFTLTNGFKADYTEWMKGKRIAVNGNTVSWKQSAQPSNTYKDFRNYMDVVFAYAGTLSLSKVLKPKNIKDIQPGDVFIKGGSPGHAIIVVDVAENKQGDKIFLLAQSYMPAQETQVLKNFNDPKISPWYSVKNSVELITPQWTFSYNQLTGW